MTEARLDLATLPAYQASLDCVHCGFCLQSCATYQVTGLEPSSPRGRIVLMKGFAEGRLTLTGDAARHLDDCLGCRACEPVCPAGVRYGEMLEVVREAREPGSAATDLSTRVRDLALDLVASRRAGAAFATVLGLYARSGLRRWARRRGWSARLPARLRALEALVPEPGDGSPTLGHPALPQPSSSSGDGPRVALFRGCVADALFPDVNEHAAALLTLHGYEVVTPPEQTCCGALDLHGGRTGRALALARRNLDAFEVIGLGEPGGVDFVVNTAAGCGAMLRDLSRHFADAPGVAAQARRFEARVRDVTELLAARAPRVAPRPVPVVATYHPPCHLHHAQRVTEAPVALLRSIPALTLMPLPRAELCCGSAGLYNVLRPEMANRVRDDKLDAIASTGARYVVTANPGCHLHLAAGLAAQARPVHVLHVVSLLAIAHGLATLPGSTA